MDEKTVAKVIDSFISEQQEKGKNSQTIDKYTRIIREFAQWLKQNKGDLHQLTRIDIQQFINHLEEKGNSPTTIENKFAALSVLVKYLGCPEVLKYVRRPESRKIRHIAPKSLDRNERNRILREVERSKKLRNIAIVYLLLYTGLRVSELVALNRDDVKIGERTGTVRVRKGKGDIARKVPLPVDARNHLYIYLQTREDDNPALFLSNYKKRITIRSVQRILEKYGVYPHQLRHTYCRELVASGVDIATVAELAGHSDINITRRYSKPSEKELEQAVQKVFG
ncbi:tyrosine-type recombinase/integrase [Paenactinomyces guangxiensis]|uniref:Tyrosine-type recombinase/integrase n=1 Tax=Paenactinomyces guangxiensis TaxID=1490290 RepID=A0A7W1WR38_9BACL|nr:tyrosine-type recombinase/integrase [Paenactinomyces guangxiensis]MBA4494511.1 tyrosine-type recombinase/integrase [Paenactinomyces guangxiensis]MBH8591434.1 tyrosine-type recombinase/integrase [Paenactinomyces guangxiensis]